MSSIHPGDKVLDFELETSIGRIRFHEWAGTHGSFCFPILQTSHPFARPNWD
ncbi:hypothetical protein SAMN05192539_10077 [Paraburkholderia diazotrophica]|uniref:Uncharacterized protein n=1 Tax=Paraburkholderia diazotrophica TaxID=667676 RepID=A0A1H6WLK7_9BURK|nr:hypothetical protein SAMN05192539_10077 [Paraburkholderia diazotrophica]